MNLLGDPSSYAQIVPKLRYLKSSLISTKRLKEISPSLSDIYVALRDTKYRSLTEAKSAEDIEKELIREFYKLVDSISKYVPKDALELTQSFAIEDEINDSLLVAKNLAEGRQVDKDNLASLLWDHSYLDKILAEPDSLAGLQMFLEVSLRYKRIYNIVNEASSIYNETKNPNVFPWYSLMATSQLYSNAMKKLSSIDRDYTKKIICPMIEGRMALGLIQSSMLKIPAKTLELVLGNVNVCNISWNDLFTIYERESGDTIALASSLKNFFKHISVEGKSLEEIIDSIRVSSIMVSKKNSEATFKYYPFTPALIAATLTLLKIEMHNLRSIIMSSLMKLSKEEYESLLIEL